MTVINPPSAGCGILDEDPEQSEVDRQPGADPRAKVHTKNWCLSPLLNLDARYPITYGRIADYEVRDIARKLYQTGEILESIEGIFNPFYSFQYAFHSERALGFINSTRYEKIEREV